ncbi:MAG: PAAR domain-containing protein [Succinivibrio sp.]|nr:PAAR domain-containing protein [Succinivibrio sp.]
MTPGATLVNATATGDVVTGPGAPTNLINGIPTACMGDLVAGAMCTGAISVTTAVNFLVKGRPAANLGSLVNGVNPITGIPMATALAVVPHVNRLV